MSPAGPDRDAPTRPGRSPRRALAWFSLLCGAGISGLGAAQTIAALAQVHAAAAVDLASDVSAGAEPARRAAKAEYSFADGWWPEPSNAVDLGRLDLASRAADQNRETLASARKFFAEGLAEAPGNADAWFWLADAGFLERGADRAVIDALFRSVSRARVDPALLAWRCELGLSLYRSLTDAERNALADQLRLLALFSLDNLVRVARESRQMTVVVAALAPDRRALARFANRLHYLK